jgi:hypothetical protein
MYIYKLAYQFSQKYFASHFKITYTFCSQKLISLDNKNNKTNSIFIHQNYRKSSKFPDNTLKG